MLTYWRESIQKASGMVRDWSETMVHINRLREMDIFSLEKRRQGGDLVAVYSYLAAGQDWKMELARSQRGTVMATDTSYSKVNSVSREKGKKYQYHQGGQTLE